MISILLFSTLVSCFCLLQWTSTDFYISALVMWTETKVPDLTRVYLFVRWRGGDPRTLWHFRSRVCELIMFLKPPIKAWGVRGPDRRIYDLLTLLLMLLLSAKEGGKSTGWISMKGWDKGHEPEPGGGAKIKTSLTLYMLIYWHCTFEERLKWD